MDRRREDQSRAVDGAMTPPRFRFEFVAAPPELSGYVNALFVFETDEALLEDVLPAYSAQAIAFGRGAARMEFASGEAGVSGPAVFITPMQAATPFTMHGPVRACGISLTTLGWAAVSGLPVDRWGDRVLPAEQIGGADFAAAVAAAGSGFADGSLSAAEACAALADALRPALRPLRQAHARFIAQTAQWLSTDFNPPIEALVERTGLSERQIQRLTRRFFGKPPTGLVRRYRAIRAATLLSQPEVPRAVLDEIVDAYFDQAHMIRDIRHFTGRTPTSLGASGETLAADTLGPAGYGVVDLFGGAGAETVR